MSDIYAIVIPVVVVVVILKLCLICWRVWAYQKRRQENAVCVQRTRAVAASNTRATARVVRVERCVGPDGFVQRTSYAIEQPRQPTRVVTRTVVIRPNSGRPADPNMPPTYDQAVTGKDKSVKVDENAPPPHPQAQATPSAPPPFQPVMGMGAANLPPPPAYSEGPSAPPSAPAMDDDSLDHDERSRLLP